MWRWIFQWSRRWGRKPSEAAPGIAFLCLFLAALLGFVLWKMPEQIADQEWIFVLPIVALLLSAVQQLVLYFVHKNRPPVETEPQELPEGTETEEMRGKRRIAQVAGAFCLFWLIKGVLDLRRGWVNNLVYDGLFVLLGGLVVAWALREYRSFRDAWKGE